MVSIVTGKELIYDLGGYDVILVAANMYNRAGNGFQRQIYTAFPEVKTALKATPYGDGRKIGTVTVVNANPVFCLCFFSWGRFRPDKKPDAVEYDALARCLKLIALNFKGKKIASTIMGHSIFEGNGDKERILGIFKDTFIETDITLYDFEQVDIDADLKRRWRELRDDASNRRIGKEEYYKRKGRLIWEKKFGVLRPMPELTDRELKDYIRIKK